MIECLLEAIEIEVIGDVVFVDLAEKLVVFEVAEPPDPAFTLVRAVL